MTNIKRTTVSFLVIITFLFTSLQSSAFTLTNRTQDTTPTSKVDIKWNTYKQGTHNIVDITWDGKNFYAITGLGGNILKSKDGITWETSCTYIPMAGYEDNALSLMEQMNCIEYLNGNFIIAGNGGLLLTSTDGENWTHPIYDITKILHLSGDEKIHSDDLKLNNIAWNGNTYIVSCNTDSLLVSKDLVKWDYVKFPPLIAGCSTEVCITDIKVGKDNMFRLFTDEYAYLVSRDGYKWIADIANSSNCFMYDTRSACYDKENDRWLTIKTGTTDKICVDWELLNIDGFKGFSWEQPSNIITNGTYYIAMGMDSGWNSLIGVADKSLNFSFTTTSLASRGQGVNNNLLDGVWNGSKFVLVGANGTVWVSTDKDLATKPVTTTSVIPSATPTPRFDTYNISVPQNVIFSEQHANKLVVSWDAVPKDDNLIGYYVYFVDKSGATVLFDFPIKETTYTPENVKAGAEYCYGVKAVYSFNGKQYESGINYTPFIIAEEKANEKTIVLQVNNPNMKVNGINKAIDSNGSTPLIIKGRTMLPIRSLIEELGGKVEWDAKTQEVILKVGGRTIYLTINDTEAIVDNGQYEAPSTLDVPPQIINDKTYLPLRFVTQSIGCKVEWEGLTQTITIKYSVGGDLTKQREM
jgi:hypothetical protein